MKRCALVVALVACGGKETAPRSPPSNVVAVPDAGPPDAALDLLDSVAAMTGFRDDMCKCTDKACADAVQERLNAWSIQMAALQDGRKATEAELEQMTKIGQGYGECLAKAMAQTP